MKYRREAVFPCKILIGFTEGQRAALEKVADRDEKPIAGVVRDCVDQHLRTVASAARKAEGR